MWNKLFVFLGIMVFVTTLNAQEPVLDWVHGFGGISNDEGRAIAIDALGNVYTTGLYNGIVDFDPDSGVVSLSGSGVFVSKLDALGNLIWVQSVVSNARSNAIILDGLGNVYVTGYTDTNAEDIFISKLDFLGNILWTRIMGSASFSERGASIAVDDDGNVYTTGFFNGMVDFDPGPSVFNLSPNGLTIFVSKLNSAGNFVWAKSVYSGRGESILVDSLGNVLYAGWFSGTADFDPSVGNFSLTATGAAFNGFISKLDSAGNFVWAKKYAGTNGVDHMSIATDIGKNIYATGIFTGTADFDPSGATYNLVASGSRDVFVSKFDSIGNFIWAKRIGGNNLMHSSSIAIDKKENIYTTGYFYGTADFDPGIGIVNATASGTDIFISKLDFLGNFAWVTTMGGSAGIIETGESIKVDNAGNIYTTGWFGGTTDFDPSADVVNLTSVGSSDIYILKLNQKNVYGRVFHDFNENCSQEFNEINLPNRNLLITPGDIIIQTNNNGIWSIDSLPAGNYTIAVDTFSQNWRTTCFSQQNFAVVNADSVTIVPSFGFVSTNPCPQPDVSINAPILRSGFSNQYIYVQACNSYLATGVLDSAYVIVELSPSFTVQSSSVTYVNLGNNQYRVNIGSLSPGFCVDFWFSCYVAASIGQTLCMNATLYPADSCVFDDIPNPYPVDSSGTLGGSVSPCTLPWDRSSLRVEGYCIGDSVRFVIYNTGDFMDGDMDCFAPVRVYLDGQYIILDSIQLQGGDSIVYMFAGNGQTWRLEADQHPLHPGNSHPNATIENCGNGTWTPNLVNILPMDDADPVIDIYCGLVTGSYDPNDKTGFPLGVGTSHDIEPNQDLEYVIRFQNTGTDTAFTIVIRDTLSMDFDIFSVQSGVASHDYTFRMYGPRVLEWTFNNIMLPDSNVNEAGSHGFTTFRVKQKPNLPNGTVLENSAAIYFDFNAPIFTNTSWHTVNRNFIYLSTDKQEVINKKEIKIYPNPTTGIINIDQGDSQEINILVLDNLGRIVLQKQSNEVISSLNINHLPAGIYYISINNGRELVTKKVVKQ